jgi:hypothetical protein
MFEITSTFTQKNIISLIQLIGKKTIPNSFVINASDSNASKSLICSPVPINVIGLFVAATLK